MAKRGEQWRLHFEGCRLEISAHRLWEHTELGQINPFTPISPASAIQPEVYLDIVDASLSGQSLTGLTLADLFAGKYGGLSEALVHELLIRIKGVTARGWLVGVGEQLRKYSRQRALRNIPEPFLPMDSNSPLRVRHLHSSLFDWLKVHGKEKASVKQWSGRFENLTSKGLRDEEVVYSGLSKSLKDVAGSVVTGDVIRNSLSYDVMRLSILPVIRATDTQIEFIKVPANETVKRIKPKLRPGLVTRPQWRDRVLGYCVDAVEWGDLLGSLQGWMAFTHRGQPIVSRRRSSGLCQTYAEAWTLASDHAEQLYPKVTAKGRWSQYRQTGGEHYREWLVTLPYYPPSFFSSHFEHRNVLLHVRCDIREGPEGERIMVLQEVQSDWAQKARRALKSGKVSEGSIPTPPWLQEWPALALKLMLLHAAQRGATALAWTPGKVQVERYCGLGETGLRELYDHTLPAEANRLLRPYGKKCEAVEVFEPANFYIEPADIGYEVFDDEQQPVGTAATWDEAQALLPDGAHEVLRPMHGVQLDAELRDRLLELPLYAWGGQIR